MAHASQMERLWDRVDPAAVLRDEIEPGRRAPRRGVAPAAVRDLHRFVHPRPGPTSATSTTPSASQLATARRDLALAGDGDGERSASLGPELGDGGRIVHVDFNIDDCAVGDSEYQQLVRVEVFAVAFSSIVHLPDDAIVVWADADGLGREPLRVRLGLLERLPETRPPVQGRSDWAVPDCAVGYQIEAPLNVIGSAPIEELCDDIQAHEGRCLKCASPHSEAAALGGFMQ